MTAAMILKCRTKLEKCLVWTICSWFFRDSLSPLSSLLSVPRCISMGVRLCWPALPCGLNYLSLFVCAPHCTELLSCEADRLEISLFISKLTYLYLFWLFKDRESYFLDSVFWSYLRWESKNVSEMTVNLSYFIIRICITCIQSYHLNGIPWLINK